VDVADVEAVPLARRGPEDARAEVAEDIGALELGQCAAAIDVAVGDGAVRVVLVLENGQGVGGRVTGRRRGRAGGGGGAEGALHHLPAVVLAASAVGRLEGDLLP